MIRFFIMPFLALVMFIPAAQAAVVRTTLSPTPFEGPFLAIAKATGSDFLDKSVTLKEKSKFALYQLVNHEVVLNTFILKKDGKIMYLGNKLAASGEKVLFQLDYVSYQNVIVGDKTKKLGILLRIEAEVITRKADINLNGIFAIGAAVTSGSASGRLRVKIFGLSGKPIIEAIPSPSNISEDSLLNAFTSIASIKSKMYEEDVYVIPQELPEFSFELGRKEE